jgi:hypothetical protein
MSELSHNPDKKIVTVIRRTDTDFILPILSEEQKDGEKAETIAYRLAGQTSKVDRALSGPNRTYLMHVRPDTVSKEDSIAKPEEVIEAVSPDTAKQLFNYAAKLFK